MKTEHINQAKAFIQSHSLVISARDEKTILEAFEQVDKLQKAFALACRVCGCTENNACPGGCSWVGPDLCSSCVEIKSAHKK